MPAITPSSKPSTILFFISIFHYCLAHNGSITHRAFWRLTLPSVPASKTGTTTGLTPVSRRQLSGHTMWGCAAPLSYISNQ
jgi:hypothetical protein